MSTALQLELKDAASPGLAELVGLLTDKSGIHESIASQAENLTRDYLAAQVPLRHKTANRLGATPTGHLERAAQSVTSRADADGAIVGVTSPGISRAFKALEITPKNSKYLTIPATAEAYGRRARSFNDLRVQFFGKDKLALVKAEQSSLADRKQSGFKYEAASAGLGWKKHRTVYYWLKKSVKQPQDRTLLPSDALYLAAAEEGAINYFSMLADAAGA